MFSDEALRHAAANSLAAFTETAERGYDPELPWEPSETFLRKLRRLTRRADHPVIYHTMRTAAAVFLAMLTAAAAWLSVDQQAQATFIRYVGNSVIYEFSGTAKLEELPEYDFSPEPEDYWRAFGDYGDALCSVVYNNADRSSIVLSYHAVSEEIISAISFSNGEYTHETVTFGAYIGDFYAPKDGSGTNELVWIDEETGIYFQISAFLEKEELMQLALSVTEQ